MKKWIRVFLVFTLIFILTGCKKNYSEESQNYKHFCYISVECKTILKNKNKLDKNLLDYIPKDGIIMSKRKVGFNKKETVYDVLRRELKKENILMEASFTGGSAYVEGINNFYEFSCGNDSGWMYSVNKKFPNVSCSDYYLKDGDNVEWRYTCALGEDIK